MNRREVEENRMADLVSQVIRELEKQLDREIPVASGKEKAVVLGHISKEEEKELSSLYVLADPKENKTFDVVVAASLSVEAMAQAALGNPVERDAACVVHGLLEGKKVFLLEKGMEYRKYKDTAYKTLYYLYQQYEDTLEKLGVRIISDLLELREQAGLDVRAAEPESLNLSALKVLQESDLKRARKSGAGTLIIGKRAIITPLAQDYIANHHLTVRRQ